MAKKKSTLIAMSTIMLEDGTKLRPGDTIDQISDVEKEKYLKCEMIVDTSATIPVSEDEVPEEEPTEEETPIEEIQE